MNQVHIVFRTESYESDTIYAIHQSLEIANKKAAELNKALHKRDRHYVEFMVETYEVGE